MLIQVAPRPSTSRTASIEAVGPDFRLIERARTAADIARFLTYARPGDRVVHAVLPRGEPAILWRRASKRLDELFDLVFLNGPFDNIDVHPCKHIRSMHKGANLSTMFRIWTRHANVFVAERTATTSATSGATLPWREVKPAPRETILAYRLLGRPMIRTCLAGLAGGRPAMVELFRCGGRRAFAVLDGPAAPPVLRFVAESDHH